MAHMTVGDVARRSNLRCISLHVMPTARYVSIITDDDRIERYVRTTYARLVVDHVDSTTVDEAVIATGSGPATVTFNGGPLPRPRSNDRFHPLNSGAYLVDQFLWRSLAQDATWLSIYGCAVALNGRAIAIVGPSGTGKTTLGLALTRLGAALYGDEMIVIHRREAIVTVVGRRLTVREPTLAMIGDDRLSTIVRSSERFSDGDERTYFVERSALDGVLAPMPEPLPLGALVVLRRNDGASRLEPLTRARAAVSAARYLGTRPGDVSEVAAFAGVLRDAQTFALAVSDPHEAAALLVAELRRC